MTLKYFNGFIYQSMFLATQLGEVQYAAMLPCITRGIHTLFGFFHKEGREY